jgi:DNA-binding SARP family transcriptional activator
MLTIQLLGTFCLSYDEQPITNINTQRLQSLLAYLVLHCNAPQPRQHLAFQFWPDSSESQARRRRRYDHGLSAGSIGQL